MAGKHQDGVMGKPKDPKNPSTEPVQRNKPTTISKEWRSRGRGTPRIGLVNEAFRGGHITLEEATDLNPRYVAKEKRVSSKTGKEYLPSNKKLYVPDQGRTPKITDVYRAVAEGNIDVEQAVDLNKKYANSAARSNARTQLLQRGEVFPRTPHFKSEMRKIRGEE